MTKIQDIKTDLNYIDQLLIMAVNLGFYGSNFLPERISNINEVKEIQPFMDIEVDGSITPETIQLVIKQEQTCFVSGFIYNKIGKYSRGY